MLAVIMLAVIKVTSYGGEDHRSEHRIPGAVVFGLDVRAKYERFCCLQAEPGAF